MHDCMNIYLLKAFITNLEVVITISTDSLPTTYRQITNRRPTVGRQIVTTVEKLVGRQLAVCRPTVGQLSAVCRPTVGQQSVEVSCSSLLPICMVKTIVCSLRFTLIIIFFCDKMRKTCSYMLRPCLIISRTFSENN